MSTQGFIEVKPKIGLGRSGGGQWQYVPAGGGRLTAIKTTPDAQLCDVSGPIEVFEIQMPAPPNASQAMRTWSTAAIQARSQNPALQGARFFAVKGKAAGEGRFRVGAFWLNVDVGDPGQVVPVHIHLVSDVGGSAQLRSFRSESQVREMLQEANKVLEPQSDFRFELQGVHPLTCGVNGSNTSFGGPIKHDRVPETDAIKSGDQTQWLLRKGRPDAVNIFFVWGFTSTQQHSGVPDPKAVAIHDRFILMSNAYTRADVAGPVMVHEFLHNCSLKHDGENDSIMFPTPSVANVRLNHRRGMRAWNQKAWSTAV